jgi:hypothetical protein
VSPTKATKAKSKGTSEASVPPELFDEAASLEEVLHAMNTHLAAKYQERTLEQLEDKREAARQRFEEHSQTLAQAQDLVSSAYVEDAKGMDEDDLDVDPVGKSVRGARKLLVDAVGKRWRAALAFVELDHVIRLRRAEELSERQQELGPAIAELDEQIRKLQAERDDLWGKNADVSNEIRENVGDVKSRVDSYRGLLKGPDLQQYERLGRAVGA